MPESAQEQKDNASANINIASQGLPNPKEEENVEQNIAEQSNQPKRDEHGAVKSPTTGSTVAANAKVSSPNPKTISPPTPVNKPNLPVQGNKPSPVAQKSSVTNPHTLVPGKIGVISSKTETDNGMGVIIYLERNDGVILQLPMSFIDKQDLYGAKNMFDLLGKIINLPKDKLEEEFSSFIKGQ